MEDADWHIEAAKEIPVGDLLIVADDAHRFDFLDRLLLLVRNLGQRQSVKLVLGARPSGSGSIDASLSIRFDVSQIKRFPQLQRVGNQSVRDLALEVLGADHAQHAVALAAVSADTPLVTVVGGRLIARGEIPPAMLANEDDFRHQVFDRFSAEYEKLLPAGPVNWRQLLNLIAAVGPLTPTAKQFVEPAAEILHIRPDEIASAIDLLEKHGLLLRGGRLVRIVPDLLSDFLLEGACLTRAGESTGFSDLVFEKFQSTHLSNVLRNLGELDWCITQRNQDQGARLLDEVLARIPQSDDLVIFDAFSTGEWDLDGHHEDLAEADRYRRELISRGVAAFRAKFPDGRRQVEGLVQLVKDAEQAGIDPGSKPYGFIEELCSEEFVRAFLPYAMNDAHPLLAQLIMVPLRWLRQTDPVRYGSAGIEAATNKNYLVAYGTANAVSYGPNLNAPIAEDVPILQALSRHPAVAVRYLTFTGIRRLGAHRQHEREAIEMLLMSDISDDSKMADEMCGALDYAGINKEHLSEDSNAANEKRGLSWLRSWCAPGAD